MWSLTEFTQATGRKRLKESGSERYLIVPAENLMSD
jgi:hypothetical protein